MTIELDAELVAGLKRLAHRRGIEPEALALEVLRERCTPLDEAPDPARIPLPAEAQVPPFEPRDEWERRLLALGTDCGVSLSDEALSREEMYD